MKPVEYAVIAFVFMLAASTTHTARAEPVWTTYHHDARRSGDDPDATQPIEPVLAWQSVDLGAPIWSQPLVVGEEVFVATVGDEVFALDASTGAVVWQKSVGAPVPSHELPCGDVTPTVGIVGTPVIDLEMGAIFVVADRWSAISKTVQHVLVGLSLASGEEVLSTNVDPPGADPKALLQRTALNLDAGDVIFGYGGNDGDCGDYKGAVVAAPESGASPRFWQYRPAPPSSSGGAVWATAGPAVDGPGNVYASTGNPNPPEGQKATTFDYSDSVVKLNPAEDFVADPRGEASPPLAGFEPPTWEVESNSDLDLGSAAPEPLPGELLFQAGKSGTGYLLDEQTMMSVFSGPVCGPNAGFSGSFGGDSFAAATLYIPCENGVQALAYSQAGKSFTPLWQGPSDAVGPPIVSAGLVWSVATGRFDGGGTTLYGLDPLSGIPRYTKTLPSPVIDHFASPSAGGGRLFVATGCTVTAYQVAQVAQPSPGSGGSDVPCPSTPESEGEAPTEETKIPGQTGTSTQSGSNSLSLRAPNVKPATGAAKPLHTHLYSDASGRVRVALRCVAHSGCNGTISLLARSVGISHPRHRAVAIARSRKSFGPTAGTFAVHLRLSKRGLTLLRGHKGRLAILVAITTPGAPVRTQPATLTLM